MVPYIFSCIIGCITSGIRLRVGVAAWFARCVFWSCIFEISNSSVERAYFVSYYVMSLLTFICQNFHVAIGNVTKAKQTR